MANLMADEKCQSVFTLDWQRMSRHRGSQVTDFYASMCYTAPTVFLGPGVHMGFMEEKRSERRCRDYKLLAGMAFNLVAVWFLTGLRALDTRHRLTTMEIAALLLIPLT